MKNEDPQLSMLYVFPALSSQVWGSLARLRPGSIGHVGWSKNESSPLLNTPSNAKETPGLVSIIGVSVFSIGVRGFLLKNNLIKKRHM